jgi:hypothetical protein
MKPAPSLRLVRNRVLVAALLLPALASAHRATGQSGETPAVRQSTLVGLARQDIVWVVGAYGPPHGWRKDDAARSLFSRGQNMNVYNWQRRVGSTTLSAVESGEEVGGWLAKGSRRFTGESPLLALVARHNVSPRVPRAQALTNPTYENVVATVLRSRNIKVARGRLTQHLRVDLNGDGREEVLLMAHSRADMGRVPRTVKNDYSLAVLRCVVDGKVKNITLASDVYTRAQPFTASQRYAVAGCYDIDGDGTLEVALWSGYYEGESMEIYKFDGRTARRVLAAGWGV